jgi:cell division septation protein DedD
LSALLALLLPCAGCGGGGDEEAKAEDDAETPKSALVPGALDDTLHTSSDTSSWYQLGGTEADDSGLSSSSPLGEGEEVPQAESGPSPSSVAALPEGAFILQLGSFRDQGNAYRQAERLKELGYQAFIEESNLGGQIYHRVVLLGLSDQSAASALGERIHAELGITYLVRRAR